MQVTMVDKLLRKAATIQQHLYAFPISVQFLCIQLYGFTTLLHRLLYTTNRFGNKNSCKTHQFIVTTATISHTHKYIATPLTYLYFLSSFFTSKLTTNWDQMLLHETTCEMLFYLLPVISFYPSCCRNND